MEKNKNEMWQFSEKPTPLPSCVLFSQYNKLQFYLMINPENILWVKTKYTESEFYLSQGF